MANFTTATKVDVNSKVKKNSSNLEVPEPNAWFQIPSTSRQALNLVALFRTHSADMTIPYNKLLHVKKDHLAGRFSPKNRESTGLMIKRASNSKSSRRSSVSEKQEFTLVRRAAALEEAGESTGG